MGQTRAEQETIVLWDAADQVVSVYSASPKTWRRCARLGLEPVKVTRLEGQESGRFYRLPLAECRWGIKAKRRPGERWALAAAREARKARLGSADLLRNSDSRQPTAAPAPLTPPGRRRVPESANGSAGAAARIYAALGIV